MELNDIIHLAERIAGPLDNTPAGIKLKGEMEEGDPSKILHGLMMIIRENGPPIQNYVDESLRDNQDTS